MGSALLASLPDGARTQVEPFVPAIVAAIHEAFSIATANTFVIGIGATAVAAGLVLLLREAPVRADERSLGVDERAAISERTPSAI